MGKTYLNHSSTYNTPRRPWEKERIDNEMQIIGKYGLKNKREIWRVQLILTRFRKAARELLTLDPKDPRRMFEGSALMRKMTRYGLLTPEENKLDYILGLTVNKLMERRLQTRIYKQGLARSIHHARVLIRHRHIRVGKVICNIPSFMVRTDSDKSIDYASTSPLGGGRGGRVKRRKAKNAKKEEVKKD